MVEKWVERQSFYYYMWNNMNIQENMRDKGTKKMTREDALRRLEEARRLKREYVKELEKKMKEDFKKRTGQDATYFEVW